MCSLVRRLRAPPRHVLPPGRCSQHPRVLNRYPLPPVTHPQSGWSILLSYNLMAARQ